MSGVLLAALLAGAAAASGVGPRRRPPVAASAGPRPARPRASAPVVACGAAAAALLVLVPLPFAVVPAVAVALAGPRLLDRLEPAAARRQQQRLRADLPLLLDLLRACLCGGAPLQAAATAVGQAVGGPAGARLGRVTAALTVGVPPALAWVELAGDRPETDPLGPAARALARSATTGTPAVDVLGRLADDARAESRTAASEAARRAGVLAVAPLGLCFLPAFVAVGVVPVVVGLAAPVLGP